MFDCQRGAWHQSQSFQFAEGDGAAVGNAANDSWRLERPSHERYFIAEHPGFIFLGDHMPVRIDFRIAEDRRDPIFKSLRDEVFQPFCFLVHFVPGVLQNVVKKQFQQTVVPDQFPRPPFASRSEPDASVFFIQNQGRALRRELLKHSGHRRGANSQPLGQGVRRYPCVLRPAQFQNGLEVIVDGFRRCERDWFSWPLIQIVSQFARLRASDMLRLRSR